jgi:hypothetical protein
MNRITRPSHSLRAGLALVAFGVTLLLTNVTGLWLASHLGMIGTLVLASWPLLLVTGGLVAIGYGLAASRATTEVPHAGTRRDAAVACSAAGTREEN